MTSIFVSSTFRDMQHERDAIQELVLPRLNAIAHQYGQSVSFCDLRWGINTDELDSETGNQKVLDVCLNEIDRCQRPMVVILGDRYGWIPDEALIRSAAERKQMQLDSLRKSVTALEIEYGALADSRKRDNTLFYFRTLETDAPADYIETDEEHIRLLNELKARIHTLTGGRIKTYSVRWDGETLRGTEAFANMLTEDLKEVLLPQWLAYEKMDPLEKEQHTHRAFVREKAALFRARKPLAEEYLKKLEQDEILLILQGQSGLGKSTLLSYLAHRLEQSGHVIPVISGLTPNSNTAAEVLRYIVASMEAILQTPERSPDFTNSDRSTKQWAERLEELCSEFQYRQLPVTVLIDAADQLFPDSDRDKLIFLPEHPNRYVRYVMTCLPELPLSGRHHYVLQPIVQQEQELIIRSILEQQNRELAEPVVHAILQKQQASNPLYLSLLMQRLLMMNKDDFDRINLAGGDMQAITAHQCAIVADSPDNLDAMSVQVLSVASQRINGIVCMNTCVLLANSRYGLRMQDMSAMVPHFNQLDFVHFISYMNDCFLLRDDGRYDFTHKSIRNGIRAATAHPTEIHRLITDYLHALDKDDPLRISELGYHCYLTEDTPRFKAMLQELYETENHKTKRAAATALHFLVMEDGGLRLNRILTDSKGTEQDLYLVRLLQNYFFDEFTNTPQERRVTPALYHNYCDLALRTHNALHTELSARHAAYGLSKLAYSLAEHPESAAAALEARQLAVQLIEQALQKDPVRSLRIVLADAHRELGYSYEYSDIPFGCTKALQCYETALQMRLELDKEKSTPGNTRSLAKCYSDIATVYNTILFRPMAPEEETLPVSQQTILLNSRRRKALQLSEQALELRRQLTADNPTYINRLNLSFSYSALAELYDQISSSNSKQRSIQLRLEQETLQRQLAEESRSLAAIRNLGKCLMHLGNLYADSFDRNDYVTAYRYYRQAENYLLPYMNATQTESATKEFFQLRLRMVSALYRYGGTSNCEAAIRIAVHSLNFLRPKNNAATGQPYDQQIRQFDDLIKACREHLQEIPPIEITAEQKEDLSYAFAEVLELLSLLDAESLNKIPHSITHLFRSHALPYYKNHIDSSKSLEEQNICAQTISYLGVLSLNYWCDSGEEQDALMEKVTENDRRREAERQQSESV